MISTITKIISEEFLNPTFETTRQYLKVLEIEYKEDIPKIAKIEINESENQATAFVEIKHESFYIEFTFDTTDEIEITSVNTAPFIRITYIPTSEELTLESLLSLTTIKPARTILKGDFFSNRKFKYSYNGLVFETYLEPGRLESKLNYLLGILETDIDGINKLKKQTNCNDLFVTIVHHIGNGNYTRLYLESGIINRLSQLGLELTFDIYATGNKFTIE